MGGRSVFGVFQDRDGYMWFGTSGGVSRYDGQAFTTFTTEDGVAQNYVFQILQDREGHLWLGTECGGVSRYDGKIFTTYTTSPIYSRVARRCRQGLGGRPAQRWALHSPPSGGGAGHPQRAVKPPAGMSWPAHTWVRTQPRPAPLVITLKRGSVRGQRRGGLRGGRRQTAIDETVNLLQREGRRQVETDDGAPLLHSGRHVEEPLLNGVEVGLL